MGMHISRFIVTIGMRDNQCLVSWKHLFRKFHTDGLCSFPGKTIFCHISRIVADDVVMTFDVRAFSVFMKMHICQLAFFIKRHRITVQSIHIKFFSHDAPTGFIDNLFPGFFIVFKQKLVDGIRVICISAFNVFYDCHSYHLPVSALLFLAEISQQCTDGFHFPQQETGNRQC